METCQEQKDHNRGHNDCVTQGLEHIYGTLSYGLLLGVGDGKVDVLQNTTLSYFYRIGHLK